MKTAFSAMATATLLLVAGAAFAEVAPGDVKFEDDGVTGALTEQAGDPAAGRKVFIGGTDGNCLACHANAEMSDQLFHGDVGPALDGVASRYSPEMLRAIVSDSKKVFGEATVMPGFYSLAVGANPAEKFVGKTILTAQQVEDVLAYLATLKE
ncbi:MAG TPA: sulfur oxidation c-type cytochrome SoxX [Rhizobiaceae bacterium]|nr:sulfur oxidation c-type cytochrome SoxX [Rhizobiaceae bacterium]